MGNSVQSQLAEIERRDGPQAIDYIVFKAQQRAAKNNSRDEVKRLYDHINLQERQDTEFLDQEKRLLQKEFEDSVRESQRLRPGSVRQSEARTKQSAQQFSGYNYELAKIEEKMRQVRERYTAQRTRIRARLDQEAEKIQNYSTLSYLPDYDRRSDSDRRRIEEECLRRYPSKASMVNTVGFERNLNWENFKADFDKILNKEDTRRELQDGRKHVRNNISPNQSIICC